MKYAVLLAFESGDWENATPEQRASYHAAHQAFEQSIAASGSRLGGAALADADTATTLRHGDDGWVVTDGPFTESSEHIGGFYLVELPDLDAVIASSKLLPPAYTIEIRQVVDVGSDGPV